MEIVSRSSNELVISGNIKTIDDSMALRAEVHKMHEAGAGSITLRIEESFALPSAVIGYLMKLVNRDKVRLTLLAGDHRLRDLLDELQLSCTFNVGSLPR